MSGEQWAVVESQRALETVINRFEGDHVLATTPATLRAASNTRFSVCPSNDYLSDEAIDQAGAVTNTFVSEATGTFDEALHDRYTSLSSGFRPFDALSYALRRTIAVLWFRQMELQHFLATEAPSRLVYVEHPSITFDKSTDHPRFRLRADEAPMSLLLSTAVGRSTIDCPVESLVPEANDDTGDPPSSDQSYRSRVRRTLREYLNPNRTSGLRKTKLGDFGYLGESEQQLLLTELNAHNYSFVGEVCEHDRATLDWWKKWLHDPVSMRTGRTVRLSPGRSDPIDDFELQILRSIESDDQCPALPTAVSEVIFDRLGRFLRASLGTFHRMYTRAESYFETRSVDCILCGPNTKPLGRLITAAGTDVEVPIATFQHGGSYGYSYNPSHPEEGDKNDVVCAWGPGVCSTFDDYAAERGTVVNTLSLGMEGTRVYGPRFTDVPETTLPNDSSPTLMYVPAALLGNRWFGPRLWYGDQRYNEHQRALVDAIGDLDGFDVVFKFPHKEYAPNPLPSYIDRTGADIAVEQETPFTEAVSEADIVLNDWPHTAFLETMLNGRPLIYLDIGWTDWTEEGRDLLESSLPVVQTTGDWPQRLRETVRAVAAGEQTCRYDRFLSKYCRPGFDGTPLWDYLE